MIVWPSQNGIRANRARASNGRNNDIGRTALGSKIACMRMAHRHRGIASRKHGGNGTTNHQRPTDDRNLGPIQLNTVMVQQRQHGLGRAGSKALATTRKRGKQRGRRHGVNILGGIERRGNRILVKSSGQRAKHSGSHEQRGWH